MGDAERDLAVGAPFPGAMPVELLGLDAAETGLLALLRHLMAAPAGPDCQPWERALRIAMERWGAGEGARITLAASAFLRALNAARSGHFRHGDPLDLTARAHVSPEEAGMMRMLRAMRRDVTPEARGQMAKLTGGRIDPALVRDGLALVRSLPAPTSGGVMSRPGPSLRLVH